MALHEAKATLVRLRDTDLIVADRADDIRGRYVIDMAGERLGEVDDLFIDDQERKVRILEVASGGFLGLGTKKFLIPVEAIMRITEDTVYIRQSRERVATAPAYDPTLTDEHYLNEVYGHYGYPPSWGADYRYPPYRHYP